MKKIRWCLNYRTSQKRNFMRVVDYICGSALAWSMCGFVKVFVSEKLPPWTKIVLDFGRGSRTHGLNDAASLSIYSSRMFMFFPCRSYVYADSWWTSGVFVKKRHRIIVFASREIVAVKFGIPATFFPHLEQKFCGIAQYDFKVSYVSSRERLISIADETPTKAKYWR